MYASTFPQGRVEWVSWYMDRKKITWILGKVFVKDDKETMMKHHVKP